MATIYKLIIEDDEGKTTVYPLSQGEISIGRKEGNTIRLMERNVSRRHARLLRSNGSVFIEDLDSYNGIRINGERINGRYEVKEGDLVEIGDYHLALQAAEIEEEARSQKGTSRSDFDTEVRRDWPTAATAPDLRLPEEILASVRALQAAPPLHDTLVDTPAPPPPAPPPIVAPVPPARAPASTLGGSESAPTLPSREPFISPPPRGDDAVPRSLPPFPLPGGLPPPNVPLFPSRTGGESEGRTVQTKPGAEKARSEPEVEKALQAAPPASVAPARVSSVSRLICVSTSYAGREFALTRPELIIGRVEDNDIVIEHRSVSRNHAKVVFDGRAHKIIDLQSANGILVNGEEYAMTDLRKGDLIELGHVRFRFIPAGEAFSPTDDEVREMKDAGVLPVAAADSLLAHGRPQDALATVPAMSAPPVPSAPTSTRPPQAPLPSPPAAGGAKPPIPPKKPAETPPVSGAYDPSTAATVTDTPLSALAMNETLSPQVGESAPASGGASGQRRSDPPQADRAPPRSDAAAIRSSAGGEAPGHETPAPSSRSNGVSQATPPPAVVPKYSPEEPLTQARVVAEDFERPETKVKVGIVLVGLLAAITLLAFALFTSFGGVSDANDVELERLLKEDEFEQAIRFYESVLPGEWNDPSSAKRKFERAKEEASKRREELRLRSREAGARDVKPVGETSAARPANSDLEEGSSPSLRRPVAGNPSSEARGAVEEEEEAEVIEAPQPGRPRRALRRLPAPPKPLPVARGGAASNKAQLAEELFDKGFQAWNRGEDRDAEDAFRRCIKLAQLAKCYRALGTYYEGRQDEKAIANYKQYLQLSPDAQDADNIRNIVKKLESGRRIGLEKNE